jgi:hypothetical protein
MPIPDMCPAVLLDRLDPETAPTRVTDIPHIIKMHIAMRGMPRINSSVNARNLSNRDLYHAKATGGSFAVRDLIVPGLTTVIRPGNAF